MLGSIQVKLDQQQQQKIIIIVKKLKVMHLRNVKQFYHTNIMLTYIVNVLWLYFCNHNYFNVYGPASFEKKKTCLTVTTIFAFF